MVDEVKMRMLKNEEPAIKLLEFKIANGTIKI